MRLKIGPYTDALLVEYGVAAQAVDVLIGMFTPEGLLPVQIPIFLQLTS